MPISPHERTKVSTNLQRVTHSFLDRTMPKSPEAAQRRRRIVGVFLALTGMVIPAGVQAYNDRVAKDTMNSYPSEDPFSGNTEVTSLSLFDNPHDNNTSAIVRSSPDTGILGLSNKITMFPADIDSIETPSGVNEICNGETFRNSAGDTVERCWFEVATSDIRASVSEMNNQGQYNSLISSLEATDTVFIASDLTSPQKEQ